VPSAMFNISTSLLSARDQWVTSACRRPLGTSAWNRFHELFEISEYERRRLTQILKLA
jgi:hypothetical protein